MNAALGERGHDFLPNVRRCFDVTETPAGRIDPVSQKPRKSPQRPPRQIGIETARDGMHTNGFERKTYLWLESFGPVAQKGELELGEVDGRRHAVGKARGGAEPFPRVLWSERYRDLGFIEPRETPDLGTDVVPGRQTHPMRLKVFDFGPVGARDAPSDLEHRSQGRRGARRLAIDDQDGELRQPFHEPTV